MATQRRQPTQPGKAQFVAHLTRARDCRVVHADGVWGGVTPAGSVQLAFFVETKEFPETVNYEIQDSKALTEISRRGRQDVQREIQVDIIMSLDRAKAVQKWLADKLSEIEGAMAELKAQGFALPGDRPMLESETQ